MERENAFAMELAQEAGRLLCEIRSEGAQTDRALGDRGDREANVLIMARLAEAFPDDAVLSEESRDDLIRLGRSRVWIIDPLDGTREYREGRDDWAVHIGLAVDGKAVAGAVALPAQDSVFSAGGIQAGEANHKPVIVTSRTRLPPFAGTIAQDIGGGLLAMGSAGAKAMAVVRGEADIYVHEGGQHEWDNCAPVAVALAAGLHCSTLDGSPLTYNRNPPTTSDLLICRKSQAETVLAITRHVVPSHG